MKQVGIVICELIDRFLFSVLDHRWTIEVF